MSGEPQAWTTASERFSQSGTSGASAGCIAKKPSRSSARSPSPRLGGLSAIGGRAVAYAGSPGGTIMLSPSTAPRWKTATRTLPRASAAAVLTRNRGGPASATSEHAPDFKKIRRFIACLLSPLELWGPQDQRGEFGDVGVRGAAVAPSARTALATNSNGFLTLAR